MNSLINKAFSAAKKENRPALLTYTVAGDNTKKKSLEILKSISNYADICENLWMEYSSNFKRIKNTN